MQSEGVCTKLVTPKILKLVFDRSSLQNLNDNLLVGDLFIVWSENAEKSRTILKYSKKFHWMILIGNFIKFNLKNGAYYFSIL